MELRDSGFEVELEPATGGSDIPALVAEAADAVGADLIVVGTHGHGGIAAAVLGSVARGLLHTARCPVLAISPARKPAEASERETASTV